MLIIFSEYPVKNNKVWEKVCASSLYRVVFSYLGHDGPVIKYFVELKLKSFVHFVYSRSRMYIIVLGAIKQNNYFTMGLKYMTPVTTTMWNYFHIDSLILEIR